MTPQYKIVIHARAKSRKQDEKQNTYEYNKINNVCLQISVNDLHAQNRKGEVKNFHVNRVTVVFRKNAI